MGNASTFTSTEITKYHLWETVPVSVIVVVFGLVFFLHVPCIALIVSCKCRCCDCGRKANDDQQKPLGEDQDSNGVGLYVQVTQDSYNQGYGTVKVSNNQPHGQENFTDKHRAQKPHRRETHALEIEEQQRGQRKPFSFCADFRETVFSLWLSYIQKVFSETVIKRIRLKSCQSVDEPQKEVFLIAGIEPDERKGCCSPRSCAISYFAVMLFWAVAWGLVIFSDNVLYTKKGRCIDINTKDDLTTCFYIRNWTQANCLEISEQGKTADVICYVFIRGNVFNAVGIAFSVSRAIVFVTRVAFSIMLHFHHWIEKNCSRLKAHCILVLMQSIAMVLGVAGLVAWCVASNSNSNGSNFFYGHSPLRWIQFALLPVTLLSVVFIPSCIKVKEKHYMDVATEVIPPV